MDRFFLRQVKLLSIDWVFFFRSLLCVTLFRQPSAAIFYEWKIEAASVAKLHETLWWEPCVYHMACETREPVFLLILASPRQWTTCCDSWHCWHRASVTDIRGISQFTFPFSLERDRAVISIADARQGNDLCTRFASPSLGMEKVLPVEWAFARNMKSSNRKIANKNSEVSLSRKSKNGRPVPLVDVEGDVAIF